MIIKKHYGHVIVKLLTCDSMTQDKAHHVVINYEGVIEWSVLSALNVERMGCFGQNKEALIKEKRGSIQGVKLCLERGKSWYEGCSNKVTKKQQANGCITLCSFEQAQRSYEHTVDNKQYL